RTPIKSMIQRCEGRRFSKYFDLRLFHRPKYFAFRSVYSFHFSGRSSSAKIAETGQTGTHAPQSMHSTGSMYSISSAANFSLSFLGWMQSTGQASTQAVSLVPIQGSAITYAIVQFSGKVIFSTLIVAQDPARKRQPLSSAFCYAGMVKTGHGRS